MNLINLTYIYDNYREIKNGNKPYKPNTTTILAEIAKKREENK